MVLDDFGGFVSVHCQDDEAYCLQQILLPKLANANVRLPTSSKCMGINNLTCTKQFTYFRIQYFILSGLIVSALALSLIQVVRFFSEFGRLSPIA